MQMQWWDNSVSETAYQGPYKFTISHSWREPYTLIVRYYTGSVWTHVYSGVFETPEDAKEKALDLARVLAELEYGE
jgi:hypothetical protein